MFQKKKNHTRTKRNVCAIAFFDAAVHTEEKAQLFICSTFPLQSAVPANRNSHFGTVVWFDPDTRRHRVLGGCSVPHWSAGEASEVSEIGEVDFSSPAGHLHTWLFWGENKVWWFTTVRMFNIIISVITVSYGNIYGTYFNNFNKNNTIFTDAFLTWYDVEYCKKATFTTAGMFDLADFWFKYLFLQWLSFPKTPKASVSLPRTEPEPG